MPVNMAAFIYFSTGLGYIGSIMGGALAGTFGTISFLQQKVPSWRESLSNVRVGIGLEDKLIWDPSREYPGGNVPGVATWDEAGTGLGWSSGYSFPAVRTNKPPVIKEGGYRDIQLRHNNRNNGVPTYLAIAASGSNSICVSYLVVTDISGKSRSWIGDIGAACGTYWFYSHQMVGTTSNYKPRCVWLTKWPEHLQDLDIREAKFPAGMGIHMSDFSGELPGLLEQYKRNPKTMCGSQPRFSFYRRFEIGLNWLPVFKPSLRYHENGSDLNIDRLFDRNTYYTGGHGRGTRMEWNESAHTWGSDPPRAVWLNPDRPPSLRRDDQGLSMAGNQTVVDDQMKAFGNTIIITSAPEHQTNELCGSPTSFGPSLFNTKDNEFCDMRTKTLRPVCDRHNSCGCLDLGSYSSLRGSFGNVTNNTSSSPSGSPGSVVNETSSFPSKLPNNAAKNDNTHLPSSHSESANDNNTTPFLRACTKHKPRDTSGSDNFPNHSFGNVLVWS